MKFVAYYRVSTQRQGQSGLGLEAQRKAVRDHTGNAGELLAEYTEVESGRRCDRPQLKAALDYAELTGSTLIVAKLDRLSRDAGFLNQLTRGTVPLRFADMPFADRFMVGVMAQVADWEAERISRRTCEALDAARARGRKLGGHRANAGQQSALGRQRSVETRQARARSRADKLRCHVDEARAAGCQTLQSIADHLNAKRLETATGKRWIPAAVARLLEQLA